MWPVEQAKYRDECNMGTNNKNGSIFFFFNAIK